MKIGTKEYKEWAYQCFFKGYFRLVASLDDNVGRLLEYLDASGLSENTVVVYTSDNGFFLGEFGMFNKMWMYEESLRLPLLVRYPGEIKPGTVNDDFISILDFGPTLLDYAGAAVPGEFQGRSFRSILKGKTPEDWRQSHYYHFYAQTDVPSQIGIRTRRYKLIHYYEQDSWDLFDLEKDPRETKSLYNQPASADIVKQMKTLLKEQQKHYELKKEDET